MNRLIAENGTLCVVTPMLGITKTPIPVPSFTYENLEEIQKCLSLRKSQCWSELTNADHVTEIIESADGAGVMSVSYVKDGKHGRFSTPAFEAMERAMSTISELLTMYDKEHQWMFGDFSSMFDAVEVTQMVKAVMAQSKNSDLQNMLVDLLVETVYMASRR